MGTARPILGRLVASAGLIGILVAPTIALTWVLSTTSDELDELQPDVEAVLTLPSDVSNADQRPVVVELTFGGPSNVVSPGLSGVVTDVFVEMGSELRHLDPILEVNEIARLGVATDAPFHRGLRYGSEGPDVMRLEQMLGDAGFFADDPNERFNYTTKSALKSFEESIGVVSPTGEFDPSLVIWLPRLDIVLDSFTPVVGEPAPGAGEILGSSRQPVVSARLFDVNGAPLSSLAAGRYELLINREPVGQIDDADSLDASLLVILEEFLAGRVVEASFDETTSTATFRGDVQLIERVRSTAVPAAAIVTDASGERFCVWASDAEGDYQPISVTVVGGSLGVAEVAELLDSDLEILTNPLPILDSATCP